MRTLVYMKLFGLDPKEEVFETVLDKINTNGMQKFYEEIFGFDNEEVQGDEQYFVFQE